ncbi:MAG: hypothetical protein QW756_03545 [Nitrososphaerota archaeon]
MIPTEKIVLFKEMEIRYKMRDVDYFGSMIRHRDMTIMARSTCILA